MPLSKIVAKSITDDTITTDQIADNSVHGRRNVVINGACQVAQRGTSSTGLGGSAPGYTTVDRWQLSIGSTSAGRFSTAQVAVTDLPGFANAFHLDCTTADTSIAAGELLKMDYKIEGQDLQRFKKGTSSAESITISFYMKTNKAFTFMCELDDRDNNRINSNQFTTSTSWTRHEITIPGDTTGTLDDDNNVSFVISLWFHAGSTYTGGTYTANTWQSRQSSDNMRAVGIGSFFDSTDNDIKVTGLQMELGQNATPFEHRSYGEELALCHRYFEKIYLNSYSCQLSAENSQQAKGGVIRFSEKRANPSITFPTIGTGSNQLAYTNSVGSYVTQGSTFRSTQTKTQMSIFNNYADGFSGMTAGDNVMLYVNGNVEIDVKAEL